MNTSTEHAPLRVLIVHNAYVYYGGEDVVVQQEYELLKQNGVQVHRYVVSNKNATLAEKAALLFSSRGLARYIDEIAAIVQEKQITVLHIHNYYPLLSVALFLDERLRRVKKVLTLHNYRLFHPGGTIMAGERTDAAAIQGSAYRLMGRKVYGRSRVKTLLAARFIERAKKEQVWHKGVDGFIALTTFSRDLFVRSGLAPEKVHVKPNFLNATAARTEGPRDYFLFVGRLSEEKGIRFLLQAWRSNRISEHLVVVGDGPLRNELASFEGPNISLVGPLNREQVRARYDGAKALVFPSICYEMFPMTVLEAFSRGVPVLASDIGGQSHMVHHGHNGLKFGVNDPDSLHTCVQAISADPQLRDTLSRQAMEEFTRYYSPGQNMAMLTEIYDRVLQTPVLV